MRSLACALLLLCAGPALAAERLDLSTPQTFQAPATPAPIASWRVGALRLLWDDARIEAEMVGPAGQRRDCVVEGAAALTLMRALNTANLSSNSLHRRVLNHFAGNCLGAGSVAGTPD